MAWNEPGSGGKDPWSGRSDEQGPPDLDELAKKLREKLEKLFGGAGSRGSGGTNMSRGGGMGGLVLIGVIALIAWVLSGVYIVEPAERGVVLRFGKFHAETLPGPHWRPRFIDEVYIVDVDKIRNVEIGYRSRGPRQGASSSVPREALMLTQDENIVDIELAVQYKVKQARDYLFKVRDPDLTLRQATESAVREVVGKSKMDLILTKGRSDIAASTMTLLQDILDRYDTGLEVTSVNMQKAAPPQEVKDAFDDAIKAREDEQRLINEAEAYANDITPKARGKAAREREDANAYKAQVAARAEGEAGRFLELLEQYEKAPDVTRERLYIEAIESVMSDTPKVLVDVQSSNNLFYLPLDRLVQPLARDITHEVTRSEAGSTPTEKQPDLRSALRPRSRGER